MKQNFYRMLFAAETAIFAVCLSFFSSSAVAAELVVPTTFPTIQEAITAAVDGDTVMVEPGSYLAANITMKNNVTLRGRETARTILSGGGGGPIVVVNGPVFAAINNFTFVNASTSILVTNNDSRLSIANNAFAGGGGNVAISVQGSPLAEIVNNVFYQNATAVSLDADIAVVNNIFVNNSTALASTAASSANTRFNDFFGNGVDGPTGANVVARDPLFADPGSRDFHLQENSPCIGTGDPTVLNVIDGSTPSDMGAYGGFEADPIPFPVSGLRITATTDTSISLTWLPNRSYLVTNSLDVGLYLVHYGNASGDYSITDADTGIGPIFVDPPAVSATLEDLNPVAVAPAAPVLNPLTPQNGGLELSWTAVPGATGYKVHYGDRATGQNAVDVGNVASYTISGLTNGQTYRVAVSAYAESRIFIAVTVLNNVFDAESALSPEISARIGSLQESALSNEQVDFPDPLQAYPALPDGRHSCFIATAAYGSYSAPEVRVLRAFRDRYLLFNEPGRKFVDWYYRHGPAAAVLLNAHPSWKPVVRAALMPVVGAAMFMTETSTSVKAATLVIVSAIALGLRRKRRSRTGEIR